MRSWILWAKHSISVRASSATDWALDSTPQGQESSCNKSSPSRSQRLAARVADGKTEGGGGSKVDSLGSHTGLLDQAAPCRRCRFKLLTPYVRTNGENRVQGSKISDLLC